MSYAVFLTTAAQRDFRKLPPSTKDRIRATLIEIGRDGRSRAEKLAGQNGYRRRVGDYRIVFRVDDVKREILVARIKHRRDVYRH